MFATFKMKKRILALLVLIGCGSDLTEKDLDHECQIHDAGYSHTVMFCGGLESDNVEDVFIACDIRRPRDEQFEGCVAGLDLMDLDSDCEFQHVCMKPWTEDDQQ